MKSFTIILATATGLLASSQLFIAEASPTVPTPADQCNSPTEFGVDFMGGDIKNTRQPTATNCCADCKATAGCKGFTWTNFEGGTCWLKSVWGARRSSPGAISAEVR